MKTMGLGDLHLVRPKQFPDPEATTRATGAVDVLEQAKIHDSLEAALADTVFSAALSARQRDLGPIPFEPRSGMAEIMRRAVDGPVALVFGNETSGLTNEEVMNCQCVISIPANPAFSSLNLGAAVQLLSYEARLAAYADVPDVADAKATSFSSPPATNAEVEGLYQHIEAVALASGFYNPQQPGRLFAKIRRLFSRAQLERDEVNILRGILASTQNKTGHGKR